MKNILLKCLWKGWLIILLATTSSCKKEWFDKKSDKSLTVLTSIQDFEYLLDEYIVMNQETPGLGEVGSDIHYPDPSILSILSNPAFEVEKNAIMWDHVFQYINVRDWNLCYKKVFTCNLVLDGLKKISPATTVELQNYNQVKGNALFHRAKNYYDLAQLYAETYKSSSATTDMGLVLKDGIDITQPSIRSTVDQTYVNIISDLKSAAELLPLSPKFLTRGSKLSAFVLLARTYLTMGDYINAKFFSDSCLNRYNNLWDYNTIPVSSGSSLGGFNTEVLFHSEMINYLSASPLYGFSFIDSAFYASYDNNDLRKSRYFKKNSSGKIIFKGQYTRNGAMFSGLATDEVYLIRAECFARQGNKNNALKDLNDLLQKRWDSSVSYSPVVAATSERAFQIVLDK